MCQAGCVPAGKGAIVRAYVFLCADLLTEQETEENLGELFYFIFILATKQGELLSKSPAPFLKR